MTRVEFWVEQGAEAIQDELDYLFNEYCKLDPLSAEYIHIIKMCIPLNKAMKIINKEIAQ